MQWGQMCLQEARHKKQKPSSSTISPGWSLIIMRVAMMILKIQKFVHTLIYTTPGLISDVSKVCDYVPAADLMMIVMMTKKTNLANLAPSHRKRPQFSNCHLEYFFSINYQSVSSGALKFTTIYPYFKLQIRVICPYQFVHYFHLE